MKNISVVTAAAGTTLVGLIAAAYAAFENHRRKLEVTAVSEKSDIVPIFGRVESGRIGDFETFSHYVARQIGFEDPNECPQLCKLVNDYLRKTDGCEENIFDYVFAAHGESVYVKLIEEFDRCILAYFSYHWSQTSSMISQVLSSNSEQKTKLKTFVLAATRYTLYDSEKFKVIRTRI